MLLLLFLLMLIDGQLSFLASSMFSYHLVISSHLLLLAVLYFYHDKNKYFVVISSIVLGGIFDIYYLNRIGLVIFLLPIIIIFTRNIGKNFFVSIFQMLIFYIIVLFLFEIIGELGAIILGMTTISMTHFITYCFGPSLIYNTFMYLLFQKLFKKTFLEESDYLNKI